jgi:hypothetical protein
MAGETCGIAELIRSGRYGALVELSRVRHRLGSIGRIGDCWDGRDRPRPASGKCPHGVGNGEEGSVARSP